MSKNRRTKGRRPRRRRLAAFAEPAHTAKLYIGRDKPGGGRVSDAEMEAIAYTATIGSGGGATMAAARGLWKEPGKRLLKETSATIELTSSGSESCSKFIRRARAIGARAAQIGKQTAVLVVAQCSDGSIDADLVNARGSSEYPLTKLPRPPRQDE